MTGLHSIAVIGTGALGGYYGARLAQSGQDVHFLCHRDAAHVAAKGLVVESVGRSILHVRARAYADVKEMPPCDVVLIALKTTANHLLTSLLPPVVKPGGVVVVMQNGWAVEQDAAAAAPGVTVLGGLCFLCANKTGPGYIQHLDYGDVLLGWLKGTGDQQAARAWLEIVTAMPNDAQVHTEQSPDLKLARWKKLVWNIPYNGLSVVHRTTTDVLMADPGHRHLVEALMREVQLLAALDGHVIEDDFIRKILDHTLKMRPYKTSMLLDLEAGKPLEIEVMYERPLKIGERNGLQTPHIAALAAQLKAVSPRKDSK